MKKAFILIFIIFIAGCSYSAIKENAVQIGNDYIIVEIADTPAAQYRGLSNRESLCSDCGMLFVFSEEAEHQFVMRNMNFPLDIIWIKRGKIVKIDKNLTPEGPAPVKTYNSGQTVNYVLEVNGGYADAHNIAAGDEIKIFEK